MMRQRLGSARIDLASKFSLCAMLVLVIGLLAVHARQSAADVRPVPQPQLSRMLQSEFRLSPLGIGPIRFGMDARQAGQAVGSSVSVEEGPNGCAFWTVAGMPEQGVQLIALGGRLANVLLYRRDLSTTRRIKVGDGLKRLRHRYRGRLRTGHSASLSGAELRLFTDDRQGGVTYTIEFDISKGRVQFISAGTRHVIETFGECS